MNRWTRLLPLVLLFAACDGGGDVPHGPDGHVTLDSLPQADRDRFVLWKNQVIKDCAWEQAFPSLAEAFPPPSGEPYVPQGSVVDMRALLASNAGSPLLTGADGQLVLVGAPVDDSGFETDKRSTTSSIGGRTQVFDVSANREDGVCVVTLDGEELYRAAMAKAVPVIAATDRDALAAAGSDLPALVEATPLGGEPLAAVDGSALLRHTLAALAPRASAYGLLATRFDASDAMVRARFPLGTARTPDAARIVGSPATPFAPSAPLYGPRASLAPLYDGAALQVELLYRGLGPDLLALRADLATAAGGKDVRTTAITVAAPVAFSDQATTACFVARGQARDFEIAQPRSPAFDNQLAGCGALAADGYAALAADADIRHTIANTAMLLGRPPTAPYRGWDQALIEIAVRLENQRVALRELDPNRSIAALTTVIDHRDQTLAATDGGVRAAFVRPVIELVFGWYFNNLQPSQSLVGTVGGALQNAGTDYTESAQTMLADLRDRVDATSPGALAARCGSDLVGDRRAAVDHALNAAAQVPFAEDFVSSERATILQTCPTSDALAQLEASVPVVRELVTKEQVYGTSEALYRLAAEPLVTRALEQRWTAASFATVNDIARFAIVSDFTYCAARPTSVEVIDCVDSSLTLFTAADGGMLAPASGSRYGTLAHDLVKRWSGLTSALYFSSRFDISQAFLGIRPMWRDCDNAGFARSSARLDTLIDALEAATTFDQRFDTEQQITALVDATTCP